MLIFEEIQEEVEEFNSNVVPCESNHYTGMIKEKLFEDCDYSIKDNNNNNKNGKKFEEIVQLFLQKKYNFRIIDLYEDPSRYHEIDIFGESMPRSIKKEVPMKHQSDVFQGDEKSEDRKSFPRTEFVIEVMDATPTEMFPLSSFEDDGSLRIRIECKTQSVPGSADKKLNGTVLELSLCSHEPNIIFLMTGEHFTDDHYYQAKCYGNGYWSNELFNLSPSKVTVMNEKDFIDWAEMAFE